MIEGNVVLLKLFSGGRATADELATLNNAELRQYEKHLQETRQPLPQWLKNRLYPQPPAPPPLPAKPSFWSKKITMPLWAIVLFGIGFIIFEAWLHWPKGEPEDEYEVDNGGGWSMYSSSCPFFVRQLEDDPASVDITHVVAMDKEAENMDQTEWIVLYRAKNEYGALVRKKRYLKFKSMFQLEEQRELEYRD